MGRENKPVQNALNFLDYAFIYLLDMYPALPQWDHMPQK